jgi:hypothetical protein
MAFSFTSGLMSWHHMVLMICGPPGLTGQAPGRELLKLGRLGGPDMVTAEGGGENEVSGNAVTVHMAVG